MYIGIDGGGTKTAFVIIDERANKISSHQEETCSYLAQGIGGSRAILENGISQLLSKANVSISDVKFAFFGLPCYGEDQNMQQALDEMPASILAKDKYKCNNDTVCGWAGSLACKDGINIVSGTGSISYGENKGKTARCAGWGELFGDEGSGYWLARESLNIFTKMSDGRISKGPLYDILKQHLSLTRDLDLPGIVLGEWKGDRTKIASLSTVSFDAAKAGDVEAINIYNRAGLELAQIVEATRSAVHFHDDETVNLSYSGGVFNSGDLILVPFKAALQSDYIILEPRFSPVIGAALYAAKLDGVNFDETTLANLI